MKTTEYLRFIRMRTDRRCMRDTWTQGVIEHPIHEVVQPDGRIRRWGVIAEAHGRYPRVIVLPDGETVHDAFFDRCLRAA
ncbi:MAG TPA: hypothetical protein PKJ16_08330 [Spirochaetota bacterium]|nr:hypothetical protein [Spirochaetota bacterium]